ncbi:phage tail sheath family protein [Paracoccus sp. MC1854]|uniref:phage tail sheath family protein n=1 Tax=Paracoccus sp. MC1854 TaxID=2760306 RepID=UPI001600849E|nr:phage tail sheath family protein [Paracoccus sp. MC1854]MBB1492351.1 phage tail sheath family protein [Paracoccus sp. MC1854]
MPEYLTPGVYVEEVSTGARPIEEVGTTTAAFLGLAPDAGARPGEALAVNNWRDFLRIYGGQAGVSTPLSHAVSGFFLNGGRRAWVVNTGPGRGFEEGLRALSAVDEIAMVAAPGETDPAIQDLLLTHCELLGTCFAILDGPAEAADLSRLIRVASLPAGDADGEPGGQRARESERGHGGLYFPHLVVRDPFDSSRLVTVAPSGHVAGMFALNDTRRGVFKAPANMVVRGALGLSQRLTDAEQAVLNPAGVNVIRMFTGRGIVLWGARTLAPSASEWRYVPVRRLFIMVEESIRRGTQWVVFEPNDERLWKSIRRDVGAFLTLLWRNGALQGATPEQAFFVKCDAETNTPDEIAAGRVVIEVGLAPVRPAEFVIFRIGQTSAEMP